MFNFKSSFIRVFFSVVIFGATVCPSISSAQNKVMENERAKISNGIVKIGMILDMSSVYSDLTGQGSVTAAKMAIEDFGKKVLGFPIELVYADHQNKPDIASGIAREWFDRQEVDMIADVSGSATALAVLEVAKEKNKIVLFSAPVSTNITNQDCSPISVHWSFDSYALSTGTVKTVLSQGGKSWFILGADNAFGKTLQKDMSKIIDQGGGRVIKSVYAPLNTEDFSSYILQAQSSGAEIIGLANAGGDTIKSIKTAHEFGVGSKQKIAAIVALINDIHSLGLKTAGGMLLTESFYWNMNEETRAWSKRYFGLMKKMPNMVQAGEYSSILHYLNAVKSSGTDDTQIVMKTMKATPVDNWFARGARIREDGRLLNDVYLFEVKRPEESREPWDYYKLKGKISGEEAYLPVSESVCPLLKK